MCDRWTKFLIYVSRLHVMMSPGKHPGDWVTVSKTLTSWQEDDTMLRNSDTVYSCSCLFLTLFNSFLFLDSMSMTYGKGPTLKQSTTTLQSQNTSWQMHHSLQHTWPCQDVLFQQKKVLFSFKNSRVHQGWIIINKFLYPLPSRQN